MEQLTKEEIKTILTKAKHDLEAQMETLKAWLLTHPNNYVVVSKTRMQVVQRNGDIAKAGTYPALPTIFYAADVAYRVAEEFKSYTIGGTQIQWGAVKVKDFAAAALKDYAKSIDGLNEILSA